MSKSIKTKILKNGDLLVTFTDTDSPSNICDWHNKPLVNKKRNLCKLCLKELREIK